jgi:hypothetical protein
VPVLLSRRVRFLRRELLHRYAWPIAVVVVCVAVVISFATATAASAGGVAAVATPGWRIVKMLPNVALGGFSAPGARDAWLAGDVCGTDSFCDRLIVRHWDGTAWRSVTPPKAVAGADPDARAGAVTASSASNAWVFDLHGTGTSADYTTALHWTGKGWTPLVRFAADIDVAVAPSASDTWAFGAPASDAQAGYVAHFNGKTWSRGPFSVQVSDASALSASDIWIGGVIGDAMHESAVIERWDGRAWHKTPLPSLGVPPGSWVGTGVTAVTPRDAWALVFTLSNGTERSYPLHWTGKAWARVALSCAGKAVSAIETDGHGGLWLVGSSDLYYSGPAWFCHDANGHVTTTAVPRQAGQEPGIDSLTPIPGTRSLWATGGFDADAGEAVLKYGP